VGLPSRAARIRTPKDWKYAVIYVTRLDGSQLVVNADLIETVEHTADTVITLLDGKKLVVKTLVDDVVDRVIGYRQLIARGPLRMVESPPLASAAAVVNANANANANGHGHGSPPTPLRPREAN
jgi:flagellar protein FlbD